MGILYTENRIVSKRSTKGRPCWNETIKQGTNVLTAEGLVRKVFSDWGVRWAGVTSQEEELSGDF